MKRIPFFAVILFLLFFLLRFPAESLRASRQGLELWMNTLLPTLLPFMILSNLLLYSGILDRISGFRGGSRSRLLGLSPYGLYALALGLLCGYPMGAKLTGDLYKNGRLSYTEAEYLLTFVNNPSPMFFSSYLILQCLKKPEWMLPSFLILYSADLLCAVFFRILLRTHKNPGKPATVRRTFTGNALATKMETSTGSPGAYIDLSIMNGFETITRLGGYILLFSLLSAAIGHFWPEHMPGRLFLLGILEISTGLHNLASSSLNPQLLYALSMGCTSFGGLCILAQTLGVLGESQLPTRTYLTAKCLCGILTFFLALVFFQIIQ